MPAGRHMFPLRLSGYFFFDFPFSTSSFLIPFSGLSFSFFLACFLYLFSYLVFLSFFVFGFSYLFYYLFFLFISLICVPSPLFFSALLLRSSSPPFFSILLCNSIMQFFPAILYINPSPCLPILIFYAHILLFQVLKKILNIY